VHTAIGILEQLTTTGFLFPLPPPGWPGHPWPAAVRPHLKERRDGAAVPAR
jgi:hypothetical protein